MTTSPVLSPDEVLDRARTARKAEQSAAFEQLAMALAWAQLHPCPTGRVPAGWGDVDLHGEGFIPLAGAGTPLVAEFAPVDLAAALGVGLDAAKAQMGDALELHYRLPRLWDLAEDGLVAPWRVRVVAALTKDLTHEAALFADRLIAATPDKVSKVSAARLVQEARLFFDPDRAIDDEQQALAARGVWSHRGGAPATTEFTMTLDAVDGEAFEATIGQIAAELGNRGDTDSCDVRRARAAGILADPQRALDFLHGRDDEGPSHCGGHLSLFVHLTDADVQAENDGGTGVAVAERLGAVTTRLLVDWLARHTASGAKITLRPVIDLTDDTSDDTSGDTSVRPVDRHDPPEAMRERVWLRDTHCVFPGCARDSRFCDLDHITEYQPMEEGGPPGQTHPGNLAPLCRTHHRVKTHTSWRYKRLDDGTYSWTSPTGHQHVVTPYSRRPLRDNR